MKSPWICRLLQTNGLLVGQGWPLSVFSRRATLLQTLDESTAARFLVMIHGLDAAGDKQRVNSNDEVPVWIESIGPMGDDWIFCMS